MKQGALIIGAGGCGGNILEKLLGEGGCSARLVYVNKPGSKKRTVSFDATVLSDNLDESAVSKAVNMDSDPAILVAGLGGGAGQTAILSLANLASKMGKQPYAILARPFEFEGPERRRRAEEAIRVLEDACRHVIVFHNGAIKELYGDNDAPAGDLLDKINRYAVIVIGAIVQKGLPEDINEAVDILSEALNGQITVGHYGHVIDIP